MCKRCEDTELSHKQLLKWALKNPMPCVVCQNTKTVAAGTWMADERRRLAIGKEHKNSTFVFSLCDNHSELSEENAKIITQAILRTIRTGKGWEV